MGSEFFHVLPELDEGNIREQFAVHPRILRVDGNMAFSGLVLKASEFRSSTECLEEAIETDLRPDMETYEARHSWAAARPSKWVLFVRH